METAGFCFHGACKNRLQQVSDRCAGCTFEGISCILVRNEHSNRSEKK